MEPLTSSVLVLGGARSGKSSWAEQRLSYAIELDYVATGYPALDDGEWQQRIALHQARRPASWNTIETLEVADVLDTDDPKPVMVDCLTVWLTRVLDEVGAWSAEPGWDDALRSRTEQLRDAFARTTRPVIAVSNEVGQGIVPADPGSRLFRDQMGILNTMVAGVVDEVWFCTAGIASRLK